MSSHALNIVLKKLNKHVTKLADQKIVDTTENCDLDHNKVLVRQAIQ